MNEKSFRIERVYLLLVCLMNEEKERKKKKHCRNSKQTVAFYSNNFTILFVELSDTITFNMLKKWCVNIFRLNEHESRECFDKQEKQIAIVSEEIEQRERTSQLIFIQLHLKVPIKNGHQN